MATRKFRRSKSRKTVRRRRASTAGKILPPLDVRSNKQLSEFEKRIKKGDLTIILVWAQWCPHCHTMMPHFDAASKSPNRSIQSVKVEESMVPAVNQILTKNINRAAKPLNVEGYPSIIVVDKQGNQVTNIEPVRNTATMTKVMDSAGPLAVEAGLNTSSANSKQVATNLNNIAKNKTNVNTNTGMNVNLNANNKANANALLANIGIEEEGLVTGNSSNSVKAIASPKNFNIGEEELKGSIASEGNNNKKLKLNSLSTKELSKAGINSKVPLEDIDEAVAPSPLNTFSNTNSNSTVTPPPASIKKLSEEAEEITSLAAPLTPPSAVTDIESSQNIESISNSLSPEQKVGGGRRANGGSLYSSLARTTYTIAPAAALLATAAMVMKGKKRSSNKTHKRSKRTRKTHHRRR